MDRKHAQTESGRMQKEKNFLINRLRSQRSIRASYSCLSKHVNNETSKWHRKAKPSNSQMIEHSVCHLTVIHKRHNTSRASCSDSRQSGMATETDRLLEPGVFGRAFSHSMRARVERLAVITLTTKTGLHDSTFDFRLGIVAEAKKVV